MTKRKLSYAEVAKDSKASSLSLGRDVSRQISEKSSSASRRPSRRNSSDVLIKLSHSCNAHFNNCHKDRKSVVNFEDEVENIPDQCRVDLEKLRNLLPEIEKKFQPPAHGERGPDAHDVAHLCDFYNSVMQGNYCPHAPHLFGTGKVLNDVIWRVIFLFRHIITSVVMEAAKRDIMTFELVNANLESNISTISHTIARFLSFLQGSFIHSCIFTDLVYLLEDCCSLYNSRALPVKLTLFQDTCETTPMNFDCTLEIHQLNQILSLQASTIMILRVLMINLKEKRIQSHPNMTAVGGDLRSFLIPCGWVDLHLYTRDGALRHELTVSIITSLQPVLLMENRDVSDHLALQAKTLAANMLRDLISDWSPRPPTASIFIEFSLAVVQAIGSSMDCSLRQSLEYATILGDLLRSIVMDPPVLAGQTLSTQTFRLVGRHVMPVLLGCIAKINEKAASDRDTLDFMILTSVHFLLQHEHEDSITPSYCQSKVVIPPLLGLLRDSRFGNHASAILVALLRKTSTLNDINSLCHAALEVQDHESTEPESKITFDVHDKKSYQSPPVDCTSVINLGSTSKNDKFADRSDSPIRAFRMASSKNDALSIEETNQTASHCQAWDVALRELIHSSLRATQRLAKFVQRSSAPQSTAALDKGVSNDTIMITTTLRLIFSVVLSFVCDGCKEDTLTSILDVCQRLLAAFKVLSNQWSDSVAVFVITKECDFPLIIVDCALDLHYAAGPLLAKSELQYIKMVVEMISASSTLARKVLLDDSTWFTGQQHSFQGIDFLDLTNLMRQENNHSTGEVHTWRTILLTSLGPSPPQLKNDSFVQSTSLAIAFSLPLGARCCWLSSLYPAGSQKTNHICLLEDALSIQGGFVKQSTQHFVIASILLFLPQYLSAIQFLVPDDSENDVFSASLLKVLVDFILPLSSALEQSDTLLCRGLLFAVSWIDYFATLPPTSQAPWNLRFDAFTGVKCIVTMDGNPTVGSERPIASLQVDIHLKKCIHILARKIPENYSDDIVRKQRWMCLAKSAFRSSSTELRECLVVRPNNLDSDNPTVGNNACGFRSQSSFMWLLEACFIDKDPYFRENACRCFFHLVLRNNPSYILSHFAAESDSQTLAVFSRSTKRTNLSSQQSYEVEHAADNVVSEFFREVDKLLHASVGVSDSQLSFTMANSGSMDASTKSKECQESKQSITRTALNLLASFCCFSKSETSFGKYLFEKAFQRLVRIWAATINDRADDLSFSTTRALAFAEISRISAHQDEGQSFWWEESTQFTATLFSDVLVLNSNTSRKIQFMELEGFIRASIIWDPYEPLINQRTLKSSQNFVEDVLPAIVAQFIEEKSLDLLRLIPAFRRFLDERTRKVRKLSSGESKVIGGSNAPDRWKYSSTITSIAELDKQSKKLCLDHRLLEGILPVILMRLDRSGLSFFTKEVLKGATLSSLIRSREVMILKGLVWELGREPDNFGPARTAIRTAAAARSLDDAGGASKMEGNRSLADDVELGKSWVTSHFMYLLVSVVQSRWKARSLKDRLRAVRCLHGMLDFLVATESPQYFPQIMATVNASIVDGGLESVTSDYDSLVSNSLRLYAIKSLSKLVRLVAEVQIETVAQNLTTIVVALIPVVSEDRSHDLLREDSEVKGVGVALLNYLTAGDLGRHLAVHFKEIPFLPSTPSLESVHRSLRSNGVDFDNLVVLSSTSASQNGIGLKDNFHSSVEYSATMGNIDSRDTEKILALQKRLGLICGLLESESTSVRKVSLEHLTDLLRGNRETFRMLVVAESVLSGKRYLTLTYNGESGHRKWTSRGATAPMMEKLLIRCTAESDSDVRLLLAVCLGEVGAISETLLGEMRIGIAMGDEAIDLPTSSFKWRLEQPPWQSQAVKYELQLVTRHLVVALKAAPSSTDQHKIAFAIQQLLHLLNSFGAESEHADPNGLQSPLKGTMTKWLKENLEQSGQYDLIEPYFSSDFKEKSSDSYASKKPPFFKISAGYFTWMSSFCRWMIQGSKTSNLSPTGWKDFFFACRTAIRTEAGLNVAEFIIPLLVLDRICFGTSEDRLLVHRELSEILEVRTKAFMDNSDRQKAVSVVFMIIDTLRVWSEREVEERSRGRSSTVASSRNRRHIANKAPPNISLQSWPAEDSIERISELLKDIPLCLQAEAAQVFGMNALALQRLELEAREHSVLDIFEKSVEEQKKDASEGQSPVFHTFAVPKGENFSIERIKTVLSKLDDCDTMAAISQDSLYFDPLQQIKDSIREKLSSDDYESALQEFERALQASSTCDRDPGVIQGLLRCLIELGRYESVLNQVGGLRQSPSTDKRDCDDQVTFSYAVEAAWKLGNWQTLSELLHDKLNSSVSQGLDAYQMAVGKAILGLHRQNYASVDSAIKVGRESVMQNLSSAARESYERSYDNIVSLQVLRELENAKEAFSLNDQGGKVDLAEIAYSTAMNGWSWDGRVDVVTLRGTLAIISTRIALARLDADPLLMGSLFLQSGHRARKNRRWTIAENLLLQAQAAVTALKGNTLAGSPKLVQLVYSSQVQLAKLKFSGGECAVALKLLGQRTVDRTVAKMLPSIENYDILVKLATQCEKQLVLECSGMLESVYEEDLKVINRFASRLLQLTRWASEVGLKGTSEILDRFRLIQKLTPEWEKGHFYFGKFVDTILQARITAMISGVTGRDSLNGLDENESRSDILLRDQICQTHTILAMRMYASALKIDTKHVYQALPRLLSLWFDLVSVARDQSSGESGSKQDLLHMLRHHQNLANTFMASQVRDIPPVAFYTTMPQLISRVIHDDPETSMVVKSILQRVLVKFPQQAMWPLAWLQGSKIPDRASIGDEIFHGAQKALAKNHRAMSNLIKVSKNLFEYLRNLAVYNQGSSERSNMLNLRPWQHPEVELSEFIPPIQAALAISPTSTDNTDAKDHFSRTIPRMRAFSSRVGVMTSKAKPKKLRAYAVPGSYKASPTSQAVRAKSRSSEDVDIGELHFLVKQEAKGDLRKDARVQDLNNVINRLMSSKNGESGPSSRRRRRLHLRTFAVICLSEDIGILEWVPDTDSLRNLVTKSYNPQTSATCIRRRGSRLANFGDATLRSNYEMCQNKFFKEGNLAKAASSFEDQCLRPFPPLLYWWFIQRFQSPHAWYEARNRFTLSTAAWSAVGHVIGLGDRHSENILIDTSSGECVHVDFDCIFDKGLNLPRPEVVPFRLTANMLDAFGPTGADGVYTAGLQTAMRTLRDNRDTLLSVLEPFLKDPVIDWKRHRGQQKAPSGTAMVVHTEKQTEEAKRSIKVIDERLQGIYNLRNPNLKKYRRRDASTDQDDEFGHLVPLPVEGQVQRMIQEATSNENLVQLYVGWMPWV